jgi:hypothetical protein
MTLARVYLWVNKLPTTNLRILITLGCVVATAVVYLRNGAPKGDGWGEWLLFLATLCGIDVTQFNIKRKTYQADGTPSSAHDPGA